MDAIFSTLKEKYKVRFFLLPDYFLKALSFKKEIKTKLSPYFDIDPDMVLDLDEQWNSFEDYKVDVSSKYKKRIRKVYNKSKDLVVKKIEKKDIKSIGIIGPNAEKAQIKKDRDAVERKRKGRRSTILTGPLGIQEDQEDATNTLLGKN